MSNIGISDIYKKYKSENKNKKIVEYKLFKDIWKDFITEITNEIILHNFHFRMPSTLGYILIIKKKMTVKVDENGVLYTKRLSPNWKKTKELWAKTYPDKSKEELKKIKNKKIVYHLNYHTDGFRMRWMWDKRALAGISAYAFKISRGNARALAKAIKTPELKVNYHEY